MRKKENIKALSEIEEMFETSLIIENVEDRISITFPAKRMQERLSTEQIQELLDEIGLMICQKLRLKMGIIYNTSRGDLK